jgi:6-phospho-beta-glucosidase
LNTTGEKGSHKETGIPGLFKRVINPHIEYSDWDWAIYPEELYEGMQRIQQRYGPISIVVTENGIGAKDLITRNGEILDYARIEYLKQHLLVCKRAIAPCSCHLHFHPPTQSGKGSPVLSWGLMQELEREE